LQSIEDARYEKPKILVSVTFHPAVFWQLTLLTTIFSFIWCHLPPLTNRKWMNGFHTQFILYQKLINLPSRHSRHSFGTTWTFRYPGT